MEELLRHNFRTRKEGMASRIKLHKMIIEVYQKKVAEKEERVCDLGGQLTNSQAECALLYTRIDDLEEEKVRSAKEYEEKIQGLEEQLDDSSAELTMLRKQVSQKKAALQKLEEIAHDEIGELHNRLVSTSGELEATRNSLTLEISKLEAQMADTNAKQTKTEDEIAQVSAKLAAVEEELATTKEKLTSEEAVRKELRMALALAEEVNLNRKEFLVATQKELAKATRELEEARGQAAELRVALGYAQGELGDIEAQLGSAHLELVAQRSELEETRRNSEEESGDLTAKLDAAQEELADVRDKLHNTHIKLDEAIATVSEKNVQLLENVAFIRDTQSRLVAVDGDFKMFKEKAASETMDLEGRIQALKDDLATQDTELENSRAKLDAYSDEISALKAEVDNKDDALERAYNEHQAEIEDANDCTDDLWDLLDEKNSEIRDVKEDLEASEDMVALLTEKLAERDTSIASLQAESEANVQRLMAHIFALESQLKATSDSRALVAHPLELDINTMHPVDNNDALFPVDAPKCALPSHTGYFESLALQPSYDTQNIGDNGDLGPSQLDLKTQDFFRMKPRGGMPFMVRPPYYPIRKKVKNGRVVGYEDPTPTNYGVATSARTEASDAAIVDIAHHQAEVVSDRTTPVAVPHQSSLPPTIRPDASSFSHSSLMPRFAEHRADVPSFFSSSKNEPSAASSNPRQLLPFPSPPFNVNATSSTPPKRQILRLDAAALAPRQLSPSPLATQPSGDAASFAPSGPFPNIQPQLLSLNAPSFTPGAPISRQPPRSLPFAKSPQLDYFAQGNQPERVFTAL